MRNRKVLSLEWKNDGMMDDNSGDDDTGEVHLLRLCLAQPTSVAIINGQAFIWLNRARSVKPHGSMYACSRCSKQKKNVCQRWQNVNVLQITIHATDQCSTFSFTVRTMQVVRNQI